jgi:hypothetical protein
MREEEKGKEEKKGREEDDVARKAGERLLLVLIRGDGILISAT